MQPYQYQFGDIVFGRNTNIPISKIDIQPYNVNIQDFQIPLEDENHFGQDTLVPGPIIFTMAVVENYMLDQFDNIVPANFDPDDLFAMRGTVLGRMAKTWKAKEVRAFWGLAVPLLCMTGDGEILRIYGRPGKFQYGPRYGDNTAWIDIQAEWRRADTFAHSHVEYYAGDPVVEENGMAPNVAPVTVSRGDGDADSWVRILIEGPATHPVITYGDSVIEIDHVIPAGVALEVSSYPWQRRVVDSNGINRRTKIIGDTKYLSEIQFMAEDEIEVSWVATGTDSNSQMYFLWREAYNVI